MNRHSMKTSITLWITLLGLGLAVLLGLCARFTGELSADSTVKNRLKSTVLSVAAKLDGTTELPTSIASEEGVRLLLADSKGAILADSGKGEVTLPDPDSKAFFDLTLGGEKAFLYDKKVDIGDDKYYVRGILSGPDRAEVGAAVQKAAVVMLIPFALMLAIGSYAIVGRSVSELERLTKATAAIIDGRDLSRSIPLGSRRDEVAELTETVNRMLDRLEDSFANEKRFISDASHELRTPTAVILAQCEALTPDKSPTESDYARGIETVGRQAERMSRLIGELLEFSRIDREKEPRVYETVDVAEIVDSVCEEQRELHATSGIGLKVTVEERVRADVNPLLFVRLLVNLLNNAYQYTNAGGQIEVTLREGQGVDLRPTLLLTVEDNGIGIAKVDQPKIWERFYRVDESRTGGGNSGLGLPMVKWIVGYHGGKITLTSDIGRGSLFTVELPQRQKSL